jgi:hypothetical protein
MLKTASSGIALLLFLGLSAHGYSLDTNSDVLYFVKNNKEFTEYSLISKEQTPLLLDKDCIVAPVYSPDNRKMFYYSKIPLSGVQKAGLIPEPYIKKYSLLDCTDNSVFPKTTTRSDWFP